MFSKICSKKICKISSKIDLNGLQNGANNLLKKLVRIILHFCNGFQDWSKIFSQNYSKNNANFFFRKSLQIDQNYSKWLKIPQEGEVAANEGSRTSWEKFIRHQRILSYNRETSAFITRETTSTNTKKVGRGEVEKMFTFATNAI